MDTDLVLTAGILLLALTLPSLLSAWVEQRAPRVAIVMGLAAVTMIVMALMTKTGGYSFSDVPGVMLGVLGRLVG